MKKNCNTAITILIYGSDEWIRRAASGKMSTGHFSNPPFRIHIKFLQNEKELQYYNYNSNLW